MTRSEACRALAVARADAVRAKDELGQVRDLEEQWVRALEGHDVDDDQRLLEGLYQAGLVNVRTISTPTAPTLNPPRKESLVYDGLTLAGGRLGLGL